MLSDKQAEIVRRERDEFLEKSERQSRYLKETVFVTVFVAVITGFVIAAWVQKRTVLDGIEAVALCVAVAFNLSRCKHLKKAADINLGLAVWNEALLHSRPNVAAVVAPQGTAVEVPNLDIVLSHMSNN